MKGSERYTKVCKKGFIILVLNSENREVTILHIKMFIEYQNNSVEN